MYNYGLLCQSLSEAGWNCSLRTWWFLARNLEDVLP